MSAGITVRVRSLCSKTIMLFYGRADTNKTAYAKSSKLYPPCPATCPCRVRLDVPPASCHMSPPCPVTCPRRVLSHVFPVSCHMSSRVLSHDLTASCHNSHPRPFTCHSRVLSHVPSRPATGPSRAVSTFTRRPVTCLPRFLSHVHPRVLSQVLPMTPGNPWKTLHPF